MRLQKLFCSLMGPITLLSALTTWVFSQIPKVDNLWWKDEKIKNQLKLTTKQVQQLDKIAKEYLRQIEAISKEAEAKRKEREDLLQSPNATDLSAYNKISDQIYALRVELDKAYLTFRIKLGEVLTSEQRAALSKIQTGKKL